MRWLYKDRAQWHRWFAWHPVVIDGRWVWLEIVERRIEALRVMEIRYDE